MTAFAFEPPNRHLEDFDDLQDYHFLLSMHCKDKDYVNHYAKRFDRSDTRRVILDNSYNELMRADDCIELISHMANVRADWVVVPDDPQWPTYKIADSFKEVCQFIEPHRTLTVINSLEMMNHLRHHGAPNFAISYHIRLPHYRRGGEPEDLSWAKQCHFLGLCNIKEIKELQPPSCDTSMPIKLGIMHEHLDEWIAGGCPHIHTKDILQSFFDKKMSTEQIDLSRQNIIRLKELCNGTQQT